MRALLQKDVNFFWNQNHEDEFKNLKETLCSAPVLRIPDLNRPFMIFTDASISGIGSALAQRDPITNKPYVCEFYGKSLWPITELEMYSVMASFAKWHNYLIGNHVTVYTDHNALVHMDKLQNGPARLQRWAIFLSQYDYDIVYRKGAAN
jgi:hypothetical protein